ncbi:MAG TPA: 1,2-phenylacetyl-CoA epoxidase subunit PaaD [Steroidobacteraceae bacterium]|jgi:ring-1,2-phenylacetyl-CoA epoxidase subunit PaaD|nr:1,2-phenylacetyl-CoA epoxidase subunit PaaD [Steroidobacteraceae bacterium]
MVSGILTEPQHRNLAGSSEERVWRVLRSVPDPEIPVLTIVDLGIVRYVRREEGGLRVGITPTYSGCPATEVIQRSIREALAREELEDVRIETVLSPPWTSEWLSEEGRHKLQAFGIAAPSARTAANISCPRCGSHDVQCLSEFGSTPCKAHYRCSDCLEPFDVFKCI